MDDFFTTTDVQRALTLISKYDIDYIYLGQVEQAKAGPEGIKKFEQMADPKVGILRSVPTLSGLANRELASLASHFDDVQVDAGERLIREGEPGREIFLVVEGEAVVSLRDDALATVGPGEFVGEMTVFERVPRSATVTALTPMRVLVAGVRSFDVLRCHPALLRHLATTVARRLRAAQGSPGDWQPGHGLSARAS